MNHAHAESFLSKNRFWAALIAVCILAASGLAYGAMRIISLEDRIAMLSDQLASTTAAFSTEIVAIRSETVGLSQTLASTKNSLANSISAVQSQVGGVQQTVGSITGTVSTLQKLANTDPELLKKYSKVYFLNENYTPPQLSAVSQDFTYSNTKQEYFLTDALPYLQSMLTAAKLSGIDLYVKSGYRSFGEQAAVKSSYSMTYGVGSADTFSADQGYSEHQLGTTVDLITTGFGGELTEAFDSTQAYNWLKDNAYRFGFELSYPKGNGYYEYEPWHWRFVGVKLATYLHQNGLSFYNMDQREIDAYLADLFD